MCSLSEVVIDLDNLGGMPFKRREEEAFSTIIRCNAVFVTQLRRASI